MKTLTPNILAMYLRCWADVKFTGTEKMDGDGGYAISGEIIQLFGMKQCEVLPHLRPLSSMTEEEAKSIWDSSMEPKDYRRGNVNRILYGTWTIQKSAPLFQALLSKGFDLFDLIPSGLALDSTTLK